VKKQHAKAKNLACILAIFDSSSLRISLRVLSSRRNAANLLLASSSSEACCASSFVNARSLSETSSLRQGGKQTRARCTRWWNSISRQWCMYFLVCRDRSWYCSGLLLLGTNFVQTSFVRDTSGRRGANLVQCVKEYHAQSCSLVEYVSVPSARTGVHHNLRGDRPLSPRQYPALVRDP